jgi:hypothetical protein
LSAREAVAIETPAARATSAMLIFRELCAMPEG